jgi:DNA replication protein DnaC
LGKLAAYCQDVVARVKAGQGLVLFGPPGSGKDHLLTAVARVAIAVGAEVRWRTGRELFASFRDAIDDGTSEDRLVDRCVSPNVLYLSDPLPCRAALSDYQLDVLYRILDGRYSRGRPTWCSVNVAHRGELDERLGPQNASRMLDGALTVHCNWADYRQPVRATDRDGTSAGRSAVRSQEAAAGSGGGRGAFPTARGPGE